MRSLTGAILIGTLLAASGGCSVKMMYNNLDRLARWSASDYVDMTDAQREYFEAEVDAMLYWHRAEELPRYAAYLDELEPALGAGADPDEVQGLFDTMYAWWEAIEARAMPMLTEILLSLSDGEA